MPINAGLCIDFSIVASVHIENDVTNSGPERKNTCNMLYVGLDSYKEINSLALGRKQAIGRKNHRVTSQRTFPEHAPSHQL